MSNGWGGWLGGLKDFTGPYACENMNSGKGLKFLIVLLALSLSL